MNSAIPSAYRQLCLRGAPSRYNSVVRYFYRGLCQAGKATKVALTACLNKLLIILNVMVKHRRYGKPSIQNS